MYFGGYNGDNGKENGNYHNGLYRDCIQLGFKAWCCSVFGLSFKAQGVRGLPGPQCSIVVFLTLFIDTGPLS